MKTIFTLFLLASGLVTNANAAAPAPTPAIHHIGASHACAPAPAPKPLTAVSPAAKTHLRISKMDELEALLKKVDLGKTLIALDFDETTAQKTWKISQNLSVAYMVDYFGRPSIFSPQLDPKKIQASGIPVTTCEQAWKLVSAAWKMLPRKSWDETFKLLDDTIPKTVEELREAGATVVICSMSPYNTARKTLVQSLLTKQGKRVFEDDGFISVQGSMTTATDHGRSKAAALVDFAIAIKAEVIVLVDNMAHYVNGFLSAAALTPTMKFIGVQHTLYEDGRLAGLKAEVENTINMLAKPA